MANSNPFLYGEPPGAPINFKRIMTKPLFILRVISMLLSIIVFSVILSGGWQGGKCILNTRISNCDFITFVGVISLLIALSFVTMDCIMSYVIDLSRRKLVLWADIIISVTLSVLWLITTAVFIEQWWETNPVTLKAVPAWKARNMNVGVAFSIFCIAVWALIAFFAAYLGRREKKEFSESVRRAVINNNSTNDVAARQEPSSAVTGSVVNTTQFQPATVTAATGDNRHKYENIYEQPRGVVY